MRRRWAGVAVALAVVVLATSLVPVPDGDSVPTGADKLAHLAGYAAVAFAATRAVEDAGRRTLVSVVLAVSGFGAGVEVLQPMVGRGASLGDAVANLAGAAVGAVAAAVSRSR
ncbi:VanZ family protein [Halobacterium rubrum]|uniref:VanZ family protein n=1 Tax=Halobacterium TaxID=2239 RepID=UPI001F177CB4|nr:MULTISPECIES: VanZ family protein [Halobacterium]MDH5019280.1 VanZ family protein [Halobacterium rubrum]